MRTAVEPAGVRRTTCFHRRDLPCVGSTGPQGGPACAQSPPCFRSFLKMGLSGLGEGKCSETPGPCLPAPPRADASPPWSGCRESRPQPTCPGWGQKHQPWPLGFKWPAGPGAFPATLQSPLMGCSHTSWGARRPHSPESFSLTGETQCPPAGDKTTQLSKFGLTQPTMMQMGPQDLLAQ